MSFLQLTAVGDDCYLLLTNGTIKQWTQGSSTSWKVIDANPNTVQITGSTPLGQRHGTGHVYKRLPKWTHFGTNATKLWGWDGEFWQWQKENGGKLWHAGQHTKGAWEVADTNPLIKDLACWSNQTQSSVYQLTEDGKISQYQGPTGTTWLQINDDATEADTAALTTDHSNVYKMHRNGLIFVWNDKPKQWTRVGADLRTVEVVGGSAGLFQRMKDGKIYKYSGSGASWHAIDIHADNTHLAVANHVYRVNTKGEVYVQEKDGAWKLLEDTVKPPTKPGTTGPQPAETYNGGYSTATETLLRIGNGGAVSKGANPFKVAWFKSDTTESIQYLKDGVVDVAITYTPAAEDIAIAQGIALSSHYIFREHYLLIGPPSNPANIDFNSCIVTQFIDLYKAASSDQPTPIPVRFLSRYDKSATNLKESELWIKVGQVPWATKRSAWYHQYIAYPIQALGAAAALGEYTLTDFGTYLSVDKKVQDQVTVYKKGLDKVDDPLLMQAHLLVGAKANDSALAVEFAAWMTDKQGGQAVIAGFKKNGEQVYSLAP
ncbi:hypothetical protein N7495_006953 [Penicillium taxi]|uniref:uncharacterized protein n=1 Tax=Penicillium taxi TaxID=168475 RepID=UPI002545A4F7|nr:uncharacterized protein N7495_006953 [Penicillium taxi]KAJ5895262.1 hypothetical protein N7495_006953 [Penicillium taxi]